MQTNKECKVKNKKGTNEQKQKNVEKKNKHHGIKYNIGQNQIDWHWRKK